MCKALLVSYAIKKRRNKLTASPSHFQTGPSGGFVSGAFCSMNMNMKDSSLTLGTKTTDYCAVVVFQDADDTLTSKPDMTDKKISRRLIEILPCQELTPWSKE